MRFRLVSILTWVAVASAAAQQPAPATQPPATFRSGTQVVEVDVRVFDKSGRFVTNLKPGDFEIREDGTPQAIVTVALVGPPSPQRGSGGIAPAGSASGAAADIQNGVPSTWLFLFDTLHLSPAGLTHTRDAVQQFIAGHFRPGGLAGVIAEGSMINNRLTTDRAELEAAVESVRLPGDAAQMQVAMKQEWPRLQDESEAWRIAVQNDGAALAAAVQRACSDDQTLCPNADVSVRSKAQDVSAQFQRASRVTLNVVDVLSHGLARMPGPKTIVLLSEGFILWGVESQLRDVVGQANRAGAHVYAIDARGLNKGHNADLLRMVHADDPAGAAPQFNEQVDGPNSLAIDTGGLFIENENNIGRALDTIQRDTGTYYVIGYTPSNQTFDGKYRAISVSVTHPDVRVRARRGYLALEPAKMLKPAAIADAGSGTRRAGPGLSAEPAPEPAPKASAESARAATEGEPSAAVAAAVRTRIDKGGLVASLRGEEAAAADDPASLGWAAYQKGDVESAERELTKASASPGAHPWVHYVLGLCHLALNEYPDAAASWERVREAVPTFEPVYFNLADAYLLQPNDAAAVRVLDLAAARWPSDAEIFDAKGVIQVRAHAFADATDSFQHAVTLAPNDSLGYYNLASAYHATYLRLKKPTPTARDFMESARARNLAIDAYRKVVTLNHEYVDEAKNGLKALNVEK
jgi:VWFA-related protein